MKNYNTILREKQEKYHIVLNHDNKIDDNKIMMKLKMKNYNAILTEKQEKYQHYCHVKLINMNAIEMKKYCHLIKVE